MPDAKTVWLFREQLTRAGAIDDLFAAFDAWLKGKGYLAMSGQIIDASIIAAPRQRNTDAEKAALKEGRIPEAWATKPKKLAQKDRDARWTLKRAKARLAKGDRSKAKVEIAIPVFGYKTHVSIDRRHGFVRRFSVTSAAAHDGAQLANVLDPTNTASDVSRRHRLPLEGQRSPSRQKRPPLEDTLPATAWARSDAVAAQGQPGPLQGPLGGRDGVRRPEAPLRPLRAHHRPGPSPDQDRARQPRLQPQALPLDRRPASGGLRQPRDGPLSPLTTIVSLPERRSDHVRAASGIESTAKTAQLHSSSRCPVVFLTCGTAV